MRFLRAEIFGFGKWVDEQFSFVDDNFIYFYGDNEAGKSTLQQFLLYMLFGLPPKQLALYKPKQSNFIGGTLTIALDEETVTIERVEQRVKFLRENGMTEEDPNWLQAQLQGLTKEIYEQIYAFSALDLTELHKVKKNELSDLLFSIGLTGSAAIYEVERKITTELDRLFKKTGRVPKINEQLTAIDALQKKMLRAKETAASYSSNQQFKVELTEKLRTIKQQIMQLEQSYLLKQKIVQTLPMMNQYKNNQQLLSTFREDLTFPDNGLQRYESLKYEWIPLQSERKTMMETLDKYRRKIAQLQENLLNTDVYDTLENLLAEQSRIEEIKFQLHRNEESLLELQTLLDESLKTIDLTEAEVRSLALPFHLASMWKHLIDEGRTLQNESEQLTESYEQIVEREEALKKEEAELLHGQIDDEAVYKLTQQLRKSARLQQEADILSFEKNAKKTTIFLQQFPFFITLVAFFSLLFFSFSSKQLSVISFTIVMFILTVIQSFNIVKQKQQRLRFQEQLRHMLADEEIEQIEQQLKEQERLKAQLQFNERAQKQLHIEKMKWEEKKRAFSIREHKWISHVREEQQKYPFLQNTDIEHWLDLLHHLQQAKQRIVEKTKLTQQSENYATKIKEYNDKFTELNEKVKEIDEQLNSMNGKKWLNEGREKQQTINQLTKMIEEGQLKQQQLTEQIQMIEAEMNVLFDYANVSTEEQYFQVAKQVTEKEQMEKECSQLYDQLSAIFTKEQLTSLLEKTYVAIQLESEITYEAEQLEQLKGEAESCEKEITKIQLEIAQLESSEQYSYYLHAYEVEREKLRALANEWSVIRLAKEALQRAKEAYQNKYLANVMQEAAQFFTRLTNGTYINVFPPTDQDSFQVEGKNKLRYTVEELSKGTVDQLYVSLRLAISKVMSDTYQIPIMVDDAFVHFDKQRAKEAIMLLKEIAEEQQVIFFTCHDYRGILAEKQLYAVNI